MAFCLVIKQRNIRNNIFKSTDYGKYTDYEKYIFIIT